MSEALIFASTYSTNPQYDVRLFIELQVQYMKIPSSEHGRTCCVQNLFLTFRTISVHNMFSPCSPKRSASDKDLPVPSAYCSAQTAHKSGKVEKKQGTCTKTKSLLFQYIYRGNYIGILHGLETRFCMIYVCRQKKNQIFAQCSCSLTNVKMLNILFSCNLIEFVIDNVNTTF